MRRLRGFQREKLRQILVTALRVSAEPHLIPLKRRQKLASFKYLARRALLNDAKLKNTNTNTSMNENMSTNENMNTNENTSESKNEGINSTKQDIHILNH